MLGFLEQVRFVRACTLFRVPVPIVCIHDRHRDAKQLAHLHGRGRGRGQCLFRTFFLLLLQGEQTSRLECIEMIEVTSNSYAQS